MFVGRRLRLLREEYELRQKELASILGVKPQTVSYYESGRTKPGLEVVEKMARHFNVSMDYFMGLTDEPCSYSRDDVLILHKDFPVRLKPELRDYAIYIMQREGQKK